MKKLKLVEMSSSGGTSILGPADQIAALISDVENLIAHEVQTNCLIKVKQTVSNILNKRIDEIDDAVREVLQDDKISFPTIIFQHIKRIFESLFESKVVFGRYLPKHEDAMEVSVDTQNTTHKFCQQVMLTQCRDVLLGREVENYLHDTCGLSPDMAYQERFGAGIATRADAPKELRAAMLARGPRRQ